MKDQTAVLIGVAVGGFLSLFGFWYFTQPDTEETQIKQWEQESTTTTELPPTTTEALPPPEPEPVPTTTQYIEPEASVQDVYELEPYVEPEPEPETVYDGEVSALTGIPDAYWDSMSICETGGNWAHYPGARWSGGLGLFTPEWLTITGGEFGPSAGHATREEQIHVANLWVDKYGGTYGGGLSGWGCLPQVGYP